ncbi:MAG: ARMT1-like domain-containing protein [bacterium]
MAGIDEGKDCWALNSAGVPGMRLHVDCFPCYFRQALQAGRFSGADEELHWEAARAVAEFLAGVSSGMDSMRVAEEVHQRIKDALGDPDPYRKVKDEYTEIAERMEPMIEKLASTGEDPLMSAVKIAIAGNVIDFGAGSDFDVEGAVRSALDYEFAINHYDDFKSAVERADTVLYLGDNTGELYFDKPLLRLLEGKDVTFVVRGGPILNDATMEYAERAGLDRHAKLLDTGVTSPGFPPERVREEARALFESADLIISKGQANFESLSGGENPRLFFLMKVKCHLVARVLGVRLGDILLFNR